MIIEASLRQIFWARAYVEDRYKGVYFSPNLVGTYSVFQSFCRPVFKMAATNAHHRCGAVNLRSKQSRFYAYFTVGEYVLKGSQLGAFFP